MIINGFRAIGSLFPITPSKGGLHEKAQEQIKIMGNVYSILLCFDNGDSAYGDGKKK